MGISSTMARSGSRGGFLGFIAAGAAALILVNGVSVMRRLVVLAATFLVFMVGAPPGYWKQMSTILAPKEDYNYYDREGRKAVMERGITYMTQYPVFGLGIDNFSKAECTLSPKIATSRTNGPLRCTVPHNSYLQSGAELGFPGLLIWGSLVIGGIVAPLRLRRRLPKSWVRGTKSERFIYNGASFFALAMIGFAVTSFFVSFAWMDPIYVMAAFLTGLYVAARVQIEEGGRGSYSAAFGPSSPTPGWRVKRSALRTRMMGQSQPRPGS
jgi:O-antigen ligase